MLIIAYISAAGVKIARAPAMMQTKLQHCSRKLLPCSWHLRSNSQPCTPVSSLCSIVLLIASYIHSIPRQSQTEAALAAVDMSLFLPGAAGMFVNLFVEWHAVQHVLQVNPAQQAMYNNAIMPSTAC